MSTAKNVTRSPIVKTTSAAAIQTKPNQKIVSKSKMKKNSIKKKIDQ